MQEMTFNKGDKIWSLKGVSGFTIDTLESGEAVVEDAFRLISMVTPSSQCQSGRIPFITRTGTHEEEHYIVRLESGEKVEFSTYLLASTKEEMDERLAFFKKQPMFSPITINNMNSAGVGSTDSGELYMRAAHSSKYSLYWVKYKMLFSDEPAVRPGREIAIWFSEEEHIVLAIRDIRKYADKVEINLVSIPDFCFKSDSTEFGEPAVFTMTMDNDAYKRFEWTGSSKNLTLEVQLSDFEVNSSYTMEKAEIIKKYVNAPTFDTKIKIPCERVCKLSIPEDNYMDLLKAPDRSDYFYWEDVFGEEIEVAKPVILPDDAFSDLV